MKNISFIILVSFFIFIGVSGCMNSNVKNEMLQYMEDKYNQTFIYINIDTQVWSAGYVEMTVKSEDFPNYPITVRKVKESGVISDNYVDLLMKATIEKEFEELVSKVYDEFKVFYIPGGTTLPEVAVPNMSVEEYSKVKNTSMHIQIAVNGNSDFQTREEHADQLRLLLAEKKYKCVLDIFYMVDGKLSKLTDSNRDELFTSSTGSNWATLHGHFSMNKNFEYRSRNWREL